MKSKPKKVYFACSITAGRDYAHTYQPIVDLIKQRGVEVVSEVFADQTITTDKGYSAHEDMTAADIWRYDLDWLESADAVIAETSIPSLGVGYEIGTADSLKKPVLAIFHKRPNLRLSEMISGSPNVTVCAYENFHEIEATLDSFLGAL